MTHIVDRTDIHEETTKVLHALFYYRNAERWHTIAEHDSFMTVDRFNAMQADEWAAHMADISTDLREMFRSLVGSNRYDKIRHQMVTMFKALEYGWLESSRSGGLIEHSHIHRCSIHVSGFVVDMCPCVDVIDEVKHMVAQCLAEMFETYLDEHLCPFVPWRDHD